MKDGEAGRAPGRLAPHSWPCNLKPRGVPGGHSGGSGPLQKQPRAPQPWRALGKLRGHASWACRGMGRLGAGHQDFSGCCWGLSGSQASRVGSTPPAGLGHQALRPSPDSTPRAPPRPEHTEESSSSAPARGDH